MSWTKHASRDIISRAIEDIISDRVALMCISRDMRGNKVNPRRSTKHEVEHKNFLDGSERLRVNNLLEIKSRLSDDICFV